MITQLRTITRAALIPSRRPTIALKAPRLLPSFRLIGVLVCAVLIAQSFLVATAQASVVSFYVSPTYGYSLAFDPAEWTLTADTSANGYDVVVFSNGSSEVVLEGARNPAVDAESCLFDEVQRLANRGDVADLTLKFESAALAGDFSGHIVGYTYIQHADTAAARSAAGIKWCGMIADGYSLVVTQITQPDAMANESMIVSELLTGLRASSGIVPADGEQAVSRQRA